MHTQASHDKSCNFSSRYSDAQLQQKQPNSEDQLTNVSFFKAAINQQPRAALIAPPQVLNYLHLASIMQHSELCSLVI